MNQLPMAKLLMTAVITLGLLGSGVWVLVTFDWEANSQLIAAATGWIGLAVGYWLK